MKLGLDIGNVIKVNGEDRLVDGFINAFIDIRIKTGISVENTYIISRVDDKAGRYNVLEFLYRHEIIPIFVPKENVFFTLEKSEKAPIAHMLGLTHFIDDRMEVLHYMNKVKYKYALNPSLEQIQHWPSTTVYVGKNWDNIKNLILGI